MPLRILVVEDHAPFRRFICAELQQRTAFAIDEAEDGREAVRKAAELKPDLILLDVNLPHLHGFEVAKQVRHLTPDTRIVFMSQESSPEIVRKALSLGAHGYIQKMSAATDLPDAIDAAIAGRRFVSASVAFGDPAGVAVTRRHEILFCPDEAAVVDGFARYVSAALSTGGGAIVLVTAPHRALLRGQVRAQGVDIDGAIARRTCRFFDADLAPNPVELLDAIRDVRAAAARGGSARPRVALCGERAGRLWAAGRTADAAELERFCDELPADVDILCVYPVPYTEGDPMLSRICAEHTAVAAF
jgi:DNA-binding response OmpR family regulator